VIKKANISKADFITMMEQGHEIAFETIFKLYYDKLFHIAKNYLSKKEDSEGIVQNVFIKLWCDMEKLKAIDNINSYLFILTKNACLDFLKHQKVKNKFIESKKNYVQIQYMLDDAASLLLENELNDRIMQGIELLPEKCRKVFIQSRFRGLKNEEIAKIFSISKRTVDNHILKGIKHMRVYLKDYTAIFFLFFS
jgi:RNA polymerase sigma-70 factor (ECF subfamily)